MLKQCNIRVHYIQIFIINFVSVYWLLINRTLQQTAFCVFKGRFVFVHKIWEYKQYMYIWFSKQLFPEQLQLVLEKYFALPWFNICLAKDVVNNYFKASVSSCGIFYRILIERIPMNGHTLMPNAPVWYLHFFFFPDLSTLPFGSHAIELPGAKPCLQLWHLSSQSLIRRNHLN